MPLFAQESQAKIAAMQKALAAKTTPATPSGEQQPPGDIKNIYIYIHMCLDTCNYIFP